MADIIFHREAIAEYRHELRYYAGKSLRTANRFERAIDRALNEIRRNPLRFGICDDLHRETIVSRFPFSIIYRILANGDIWVVALAHASREPEYWIDRV